jgi:ComF family protein
VSRPSAAGSAASASTPDGASVTSSPLPWSRAWTDWLVAALDLVFPPFCPVCRDRLGAGRRDPLCGGCWQQIPRIDPPLCQICGLPLPGALGAALEGGFMPAPAPPGPVAVGPRCGACRSRPPEYAYARAAAPFGEVLREALHAFKFAGKRAVALPLGDLLAEAGAAWPPARGADLLVPVPLHRDRQRQRGFNQAALLTERLGRLWGVAVAPHALERTAPTLAQTGLGGEERRRNVRGAFAVPRPATVRGRRVLLVDDVLTTGATADACAGALRRAGAAEVGVLTVARAVGGPGLSGPELTLIRKYDGPPGQPNCSNAAPPNCSNAAPSPFQGEGGGEGA